MQASEEKYTSDIARRRSISKGNKIDNLYTNSRLNYYRFNVNPNKKNNTYLVTQYKKGIVREIYFGFDQYGHDVEKYKVKIDELLKE